jgi:hypothetical protein
MTTIYCGSIKKVVNMVIHKLPTPQNVRIPMYLNTISKNFGVIHRHYYYKEKERKQMQFKGGFNIPPLKLPPVALQN